MLFFGDSAAVVVFGRKAPEIGVFDSNTPVWSLHFLYIPGQNTALSIEDSYAQGGSLGKENLREAFRQVRWADDRDLRRRPVLLHEDRRERHVKSSGLQQLFHSVTKH